MVVLKQRVASVPYRQNGASGFAVRTTGRSVLVVETSLTRLEVKFWYPTIMEFSDILSPEEDNRDCHLD